MKRIISIALLFAVFLCGCKTAGYKETASFKIDEQYYDMSDNLFGFTAALNGTVMEFPMKYVDLVKTGWELKPNDKNVTLQSGQYSIYDIVNGEYETEAYFANIGKNEAKISECLVCGISTATSDGVAVSLPQGIELSKTNKKELVSAYGNPKESLANTLIYEQSAEKGAKFIFKDGVLFEVYLYNITEPYIVEFSKEPPKEVKGYKEPESLSPILKDFSFYLYGTTYTMPLPLSRLLEGGWMLAGKSADSIEAGETKEKVVKITRSNRTLTLSLKNLADYPTIPENCFITSIESTSDVKLDMTLANGCRVGSTKSNFEQTFGRDNFTSIVKEGKYSNYIYTDSYHGTLRVTTNDETGYITSIKVEMN